ncbi:MAG TPA: hypothetical protein VFQ47_09840, partial [Nitrososphaera sp.]|nr:hypothetical protein [Nitrososphaera sp.]
MITIFPLFGLGRKVLGLTAITIILFSSNVIVGSAQQGEAQEESEGDLQVVLNGEVFTTGDTITISGSVDDPDDQPILNIEVVDPESSVVARASPPITADDTFTFSFEAGGRDPFMLGDRPMTVSGNYRVTVTYLP